MPTRTFGNDVENVFRVALQEIENSIPGLLGRQSGNVP
jgi:hypothetical protein